MEKEGTHTIGKLPLTLKEISNLIGAQRKIKVSKASKNDITVCRDYLDGKLDQSDELFYGINTGFGSLCNIKISREDNARLQYNLIRSHAIGAGDAVGEEIIRIILLLKVCSLSKGFSGVKLATIDRLVDFFNADTLPVLYELGSLGASGDLAPLAHLSLPLIGEGVMYDKGEKVDASEVLKANNWNPLDLEAKEGLALLNGTQFTTGYTTMCLIEAHHLIQLANLCAALSMTAFNCRKEPLEPMLHAIRPHEGQIETAAQLNTYLNQSNLDDIAKSSVQDPYAFRCVAQVHGASSDTIRYATRVVETEINSVTDNPNIFVEADRIISGGNFHAQPIALIADFLAIALSELGSISERRTYQLLCGHRNLPEFLIPNPGLNSGFMIAQYTSASIVSQNKQLCTPASVDSIVSSNGQEDHVSMGANASTKCFRVVQNIERVLAIEFLTAAQALDLRDDVSLHGELGALIQSYRKIVSFLNEDRSLYPDLLKTMSFLKGLRGNNLEIVLG